MEEKERVEHESHDTPFTAEEVAQGYVCTKICRLCPYPGLKCSQERDSCQRIL